MKVLIVEDSDRLRRSLGEGLTKAGFTVDLAADGTQGWGFLESYDYDAVVLDLMLPGMSGLEVLRRARDQRKDAHVLILSARDQVADRIRGLEMGADDYLVKPFDFGELCARLQALVRRRYQKKNPTLEVGPLLIDTAGRQVKRDGDLVHLTPSEYALLELLAMRSGRVYSQRQLLDHLYRADAEVSSNVIEVLISGLRKKIHAPGEPPIIVTRRGHGYVIDGD